MLGEQRDATSTRSRTGSGALAHDPGQGRVQPAVVEHGRVQAADELAQLGEGLHGLVVRLLDGPPGGSGASARWRGPSPGAWPARPAAAGRRRAGRARSGAARRRSRRRSRPGCGPVTRPAGSAPRRGWGRAAPGPATSSTRPRRGPPRAPPAAGRARTTEPSAAAPATVDPADGEAAASRGHPADRHQGTADAADHQGQQVVAELPPGGGAPQGRSGRSGQPPSRPAAAAPGSRPRADGPEPRRWRALRPARTTAPRPGRRPPPARRPRRARPPVGPSSRLQSAAAQPTPRPAMTTRPAMPSGSPRSAWRVARQLRADHRARSAPRAAPRLRGAAVVSIQVMGSH